MSKGKYPGVQKAYDADGFGGVWKWSKAKGLHRWIRARNWARRRVALAKDPEGFKKAEAAYAKKVAKLKADHKPATGSGPYPGKDPRNANFVEFDGHWLPKWIAGVNKRARARGVDFAVLSGFRTPAYSTSICEHQCGAPQCAGTCAGAKSNHACPPDGAGTAYEGAEDLYPGAAEFEAYCRAYKEPLIGGGAVLPNDPNHFSHAGN